MFFVLVRESVCVYQHLFFMSVSVNVCVFVFVSQCVFCR